MIRKLLILASMFGAASPAYAHEWWILDNHTATCVSGEELSEENGGGDPITPENVTSFEISQGDVSTPTEYRDSSGNLAGVELKITSNTGVTTYIDFFTNDDLCEKAIKSEEANGTLVNPNDLN